MMITCAYASPYDAVTSPPMDWIPFLIVAGIAIFYYVCWLKDKDNEYKKLMKEKKLEERHRQRMFKAAPFLKQAKKKGSIVTDADIDKYLYEREKKNQNKKEGNN